MTSQDIMSLSDARDAHRTRALSPRLEAIVEMCSCPTRVRNVLRYNSDFLCVADLEATTAYQLTKLKGFGQTGVKSLLGAMQTFGFYVRPDREDAEVVERAESEGRRLRRRAQRLASELAGVMARLQILDSQQDDLLASSDDSNNQEQSV